MSLPSPHGLRAAAWAIDCLILMTIVAFLPQPLNVLLLLALFVTYHTLLVWLVQRTVGKALLGLKVRRIGKPPDFLWAFGRAGAGYCLVDVFGAGALVALFNPSHRCLHDYVFGSVVVFDGSAATGARGVLARLVDFADRQGRAVAAKRKTLGILGALWASLFGVGKTLQRAIEWLTRLGSGTGASTPTASIAEGLSLKVAVAIAAATTTVTAAVAGTIPIAGGVADWLLRPRYFFMQPAGAFGNDAAVLARFELNGNVLDASGNGNHARLLGGEFVPTSFGQGLHVFQSEGTGIDWSDRARLLVHPYTIEMVLTSSTTSPWGKLFGFDDASDSGWYYKEDGIQAYPNSVLGRGQVGANEQHYLAFVSTDPSTVTVYFQGTPLGSTKATFTAPPAMAVFFRDDSDTGRGEQIDAIVDEIRISKVARTAQEIAAVQESLTSGPKR